MFPHEEFASSPTPRILGILLLSCVSSISHVVIIWGKYFARLYKVCMHVHLILVIYREICKFQESLRGISCTLECLLLLDEVEIPEELVDVSVRVVRVSPTVMKKLSGMQSTESIDAIALMRIPDSFYSLDGNLKQAHCKRWFPSPHRILVLEGIQVIILSGIDSSPVIWCI